MPAAKASGIFRVVAVDQPNKTAKRMGGDGAAFHAAMRADAMLEAGDLDGLAVWKRIIRAVDELTSTGPVGTAH